MAHAVLSVDATRSGRSQAGVVWTRVCLRLDDLSFPDEQWTDFTVVILGWWTRALLALLRGADDRQEVMFMEGPFSVELLPSTRSTWRVTCIERGSCRMTRAEAVVNSSDFVNSVVRACEDLLELCRTKDWWSPDADVLESALLALKEDIAMLTN